MKTIIETLKKKWAEYLLEVIVIVSSIVGALALENWNEEQKERKFERKILVEIRNSLKNDLSDIELNHGNQKEALISQEIILNWIEEKGVFNDSLCAHFNKSRWNTGFISSDGSFETLKSTGMSLISNEELRQSISELYDSKYEGYRGVEEYNNKFIYYMINEVASQYLRGNKCPVDPEQLQNQHDFIYQLTLCKNVNKILISTIEQTQKDVQNVIDLIDEELAN